MPKTRTVQARDPDCGMCTGNPDLLAICDRCANNLEMLDLADAIGDATEAYPVLSFPNSQFSVTLAESVPENSLFMIPSRAALERVLEHDEAPDLRRYFGVITNLGT